MTTERIAAPGREVDDRLPGADLVRAGLADVAAGRETVAGELARSASRRLRELGFASDLPGSTDENRLWELIEAEVGPARAHGRYNALRRRLLSFLRAAALASTR